MRSNVLKLRTKQPEIPSYMIRNADIIEVEAALVCVGTPTYGLRCPSDRKSEPVANNRIDGQQSVCSA